MNRIRDHWQAYEREKIPKSASKVERILLQNAFYRGAIGQLEDCEADYRAATAAQMPNADSMAANREAKGDDRL